MKYIIRRFIFSVVTAPVVGAVWLLGYVLLAVIADAPLPPRDFLIHDAFSWAVIYVIMFTFATQILAMIDKALDLKFER